MIHCFQVYNSTLPGGMSSHLPEGRHCKVVTLSQGSIAPKKDLKHWYCSLSLYTQSIQTPFVARCYDLNFCYIESHAQTSMAGAAAVVSSTHNTAIPKLY